MSITYEAVIGIECHVELKTESKMFCGCANVFGADPNTNVCPVCLGMPGALPVPNRAAIAHVVRAGLAFDAAIPAFSKFDRKNYFYPDMPKDYQISQNDTPFTQGGVVTYWLGDGSRRSCRLTRIHLEEDTGKSTHASHDGRIAGSTHSLVDFNRAGVPLMECVSEPDIRSAAEAVAFLEALRRTFVELGVSDVKMEEGSLRCDANVSIRPVGETTLGTKTEIKNMNSFRSVYRAIESEVARQIGVLESGGRLVQETRGWDEANGTTHSMRSKEQAHDYRYFPDPDLAPFVFAEADTARLREGLGGLPQARLQRFIEHDRIAVISASQIVDTPGLAQYLERAVASAVARGISRPAAVSGCVNLLLSDLSRLANETGVSIAESALGPERLAEIVELLDDRTITSKTAKSLVETYWTEELLDDVPAVSVRDYVIEANLGQLTDSVEVDAIVAAVVAANAKTVTEYRAGKVKVMGFLVGQVLKQSGGKANPVLAQSRLEHALAGVKA